ncbi:hypothetical protein J7K76_02145 [Candidatus Bipolaricaulota bacterium]|nr:hypothetical protein [Candidatus Bipolaricaulota bacterium]
MKRALTIALLATLLGILLFGLTDLFPPAEVRPWAEMARAYGAGNGVASIVLGSRLYDTLLEVLVFALAMVGVRYTLKPLGKWREPVVPERGVVREMADVLLPVIIVFAVYLAASGHLGPGGGFPAGAIAGSGLLLLAMAKGIERLSRELHEGTLEPLEYGTIAVLLVLGCLSIPLNHRGSGLLVVFNLLIGIEVTIGAWVVLHYFASHRGEI